MGDPYAVRSSTSNSRRSRFGFAQPRVGERHGFRIAHRVGNQALSVKSVHRVPVERLPCPRPDRGHGRPDGAAPARPRLSMAMSGLSGASQGSSVPANPSMRPARAFANSGDCFGCVTRPEQCAPVGDGTQILDLSQAKSPRRNTESATLHVRDTERIRHQTGCGGNPTETNWREAMAGALQLDDGARARQSHSGASGRSGGGVDCADPVFQPSNGEAHRFQRPVNSQRFNPLLATAASRAFARHTLLRTAFMLPSCFCRR